MFKIYLIEKVEIPMTPTVQPILRRRYENSATKAHVTNRQTMTYQNCQSEPSYIAKIRASHILHTPLVVLGQRVYECSPPMLSRIQIQRASLRRGRCPAIALDENLMSKSCT